MLKQATLEAIAKLAKIKPEDLKAAIEDEKEADLAVDEKVQSFTEDELGTLKSNSYKEGKTAGVEIAVKDVKEELKLEFQGKSVKGLVEAAQKKAVEDAKIPANEQVKELTTKLATLQNTITEQDKKLADKEQEVEGIRIKSELYKVIPAGGTLENDEVIELMKLKGYAFEQKDGKTVVKLNGEVQNDKLGNPLAAKDIITGFMKEKKLIADESGGGGPEGRGGDTKPPVKFTKFSELKKHYESKGISTMGQEFNEAVQKAVADNKDFDMNA